MSVNECWKMSGSAVYKLCAGNILESRRKYCEFSAKTKLQRCGCVAKFFCAEKSTKKKNILSRPDVNPYTTIRRNKVKGK